MGKSDALNKVIDFAKDKLKETAIEIGKDATDKLKNKAINASNEAIEKMSNKATKFIKNTVDPGKKKSIDNNKLEIIPKERSIKENNKNNAVKDNMTEAEEEIFQNNLTSNLMNVGLSAIKNPQQAFEVINTLVHAAGEVRKFQELQITKRAVIESIRQQALARIDMQKTLLMTYLEKTFDERKEIFKQHFKVVDDALTKGNMQQLALGLDSINNLANSSPFKNLASIENVGNALDNPNTEWEF